MIDKTKMFGLLHDEEGKDIERQVRFLKVGIGLPKGPAVHVYIDANGDWKIQAGVKKAEIKMFTFKSDEKQKAIAAYRELRRNTPDRPYPQKIPYFTFLKVGLDGSFTHDFNLIEMHGPMPTEIDIVCLNEDPQEYSFQWFTAAELKCEGNGHDARRRNDLAKTPEELKLAKQAAEKGEKFFPIINGCYARGCMYARGDKPACKPHSRLYFQLAGSPRIGGSVTFDTTGFGSTSWIRSSILGIKKMTGGGKASRGFIAGIQLIMALRPYKTSHNGVPSTQYGVALEARASTAVELVKSLAQQSGEFRSAARLAAPPLQIEAGDDPNIVDAETEDPDVDAPIMAAEFYAECGEEYPEDMEEMFDGDDDGPDGKEPIREPQQTQEQLKETAKPAVDKTRVGWLQKLEKLEVNLGTNEFYRRLGGGPDSYTKPEEILTSKMAAAFQAITDDRW